MATAAVTTRYLFLGRLERCYAPGSDGSLPANLTTAAHQEHDERRNELTVQSCCERSSCKHELHSENTLRYAGDIVEYFSSIVFSLRTYGDFFRIFWFSSYPINKNHKVCDTGSKQVISLLRSRSCRLQFQVTNSLSSYVNYRKNQFQIKLIHLSALRAFIKSWANYSPCTDSTANTNFRFMKWSFVKSFTVFR